MGVWDLLVKVQKMAERAKRSMNETNLNTILSHVNFSNHGITNILALGAVQIGSDCLKKLILKAELQLN